VSKLIPSLAFLFTAALTSVAADAYKWSVQYIVDNSIAVQGLPQSKFPRGNRALALSPDGRFLYAGYMHSWNGQGEVRKIAVDRQDLTEKQDFEAETVNVLAGVTGKAIATDDRGRVYVADRRGVAIYDSELENELGHVLAGNCEGIALVRDGSKLLMFTSERDRGDVSRWVVTEEGAQISRVERAGFDGTGIFHVAGAYSLRGLKVDATGNIWVCDYEAGKVFRVRRDGKDVRSVEVKKAVDVAFDGDRVFVTRGTDRTITVMDKEMVVIGSLNVPWQELELSLVGNNQHGALTGIVTVPGKGFYVANEWGQTIDQQSIYGKADDLAELIDGKVIRDTKNDDNDPILKATAVITTAAK